jgi:hypothetical protein
MDADVNNMYIHCLSTNYNTSTFSALQTLSDYLESLGLKSALKCQDAIPLPLGLGSTHLVTKGSAISDMFSFSAHIFKCHACKCNPKNTFQSTYNTYCSSDIVANK